MRHWCIWTPMILAFAVLSSGCTEETKSLCAPPSKLVVETYTRPSPTAIDPSTQPSGYIAPVAPPVIIENNGRTTIIYTCRHTRCDVLKEAIENFASPEGTVQASPLLNTLLINDSPEMAPALLKMVEELDRPQPQLLVEARVIEVTLDNDFEYEMKLLFTQLPDGFKKFLQTSGIVLGTPGINANPTQGGQLLVRPLVGETDFMDYFIRLLVTKGYGKILSSPNLIVAAGTEAGIITGEEVPIQSATVVSGSVSTTTIFKPVGIRLHVLPLQIAGDTAKLEINPEVSAVTGFTAAGSTGVSNPIVAVRNVRSTVTMKDGQTLTIGGLLRSEDRKIIKKVPVLGDIPGLGLLFQSQRIQTTNSQLIFFLRVKILPQGEPDDFVYHKPGSGLYNAENAKIVNGRPSTGPAKEPESMPAPRIIRLTPPAQPLSPTPLPPPGITPPAANPPDAIPPGGALPGGSNVPAAAMPPGAIQPANVLIVQPAVTRPAPTPTAAQSRPATQKAATPG